MELFGDKTIALFDLWSLQHLMVGLLIGWYVARNISNRLIFIVTILSIAYGWELLEFLAEIGKFGDVIAHWFGGVELVVNRLFIDPLALLAGSLVGRKFSNLKIISLASLFVFGWLTINLLSPNVMTIQEQILK